MRRLLVLITLLMLAVAVSANATVITILNNDGPGEGFNDPTPVAPVGFGAEDGMPPHDAQEPIAMIAAAFSAHFFSVSMAFLPPTWQ